MTRAGTTWREIAPAASAAAEGDAEGETMLLTFKSRLNPDKRQHRDLRAYLDQERHLYNAALEQRIAAYSKINNAKFQMEWEPCEPYRLKDGTIVTGRYVRRPLLNRKVEAKNGTTGNRRRMILAAVLMDQLTVAQRLDMLDRLEPVSAGLADDLAAFYAGHGEEPASLARDLLFAAPNPRQALTRTRLQAEMRRRWNASKAGLSAIDQSRELTLLRADDPAYGQRQRRVQRNELNKLQKTYEAMWRGGGYPKFKGRDHFKSFAFDAFQQITYERGRLRFTGMAGGLRVMKDRPLPQVWDKKAGEYVTRIKNVWFKAEDRCGDRINRWHVGFQVEVPCAPKRVKGQAVGVDWGTSVLAALDTGETIANPRFGEQAARALARSQRKVARRVKGSKRRAKALSHKRAIERKTANRRRTYLDKFSKRLATHYSAVAIETFPIKGLMDAERPGEKLPEFVKTDRNRKVLDTAPYLLRQMTTYKTQLYGATLLAIDPTDREAAGDGFMAQPTQRCRFCNELHFKEPGEDNVCRKAGVFKGMRLPRKVNAAGVIKQLAREISPLAGDDRGGPVPGGAVRAANGGTGLRRLGKTEGGQPLLGRRSQKELPSRTHGQAPRPPPGRLRTEPS